MTNTNTNAAEGKWVQGGGVELPCVFRIYGQICNKLAVKNMIVKKNEYKIVLFSFHAIYQL